MADSENPAASIPEAAATSDEPWLGIFDWIILGLALAGGLYYLFVTRRGKKNGEYSQFATTIKPISPMNGSSYAKSDDRSFVAKMKSSVSEFLLWGRGSFYDPDVRYALRIFHPSSTCDRISSDILHLPSHICFRTRSRRVDK